MLGRLTSSLLHGRSLRIFPHAPVNSSFFSTKIYPNSGYPALVYPLTPTLSAKHFFDDPDHLVRTALHSLTLTNPALAFDPENKVIFRRPEAVTKNKVAIVSGGGSGHEPAFAGFVGRGFLDASAAGTIFASPSAEQIRKAAMDFVDNEKGVLIIPMNYTGDVLNFGMAAEKARAAGIKTEFFAINDDAGVGKKKGGKVGRRGIGGGVLILKIVSALAEAG